MFKIIKQLTIYCFIFFFTFSIGYVLILKWVPTTITPLKVMFFFQNMSSENKLIYSSWANFGEINPTMVKSVIASEDNNFLTHHGFDWEAIEKAIAYNKINGHKRILGASTISQQTAKNVFCIPDRTWLRKGFETYYTILIELLWSKEDIMETYLNIIETRPNVYGVEATAHKYYKKSAIDLNPHESSMIAAALPSPRRMNIVNPSTYHVNRASKIRRLVRGLPELDFESPDITLDEK